MSDIRTYKFKGLKGIDDLKGQLPGHGATDWWTKEQWDKWNRELPEMLAWNERYIAECKANGTYGEEYTITIHMEYNPAFDHSDFEGESPISSYGLMLLTPNGKDDGNPPDKPAA